MNVFGLFAFTGLLLLVFAYQRCNNVGYAAAIISCTSIFTILPYYEIITPILISLINFA